MKRVLSGLATIIVAVAFSWLNARAADSPVIPPGSVLKIKLGTTITSKTNKVGDAFTGQVVQPITQGDQEIVPTGSIVTGHVAFMKPSKRIKGKAQMRIVLDSITTPEDKTLHLSSTLEDAKGGVCGNTASDEEGTIVGCGKSKKDAAKDAAIGGAIGAGAGATVGMGSEIECRYYGNCGGPGMGATTLYGAGIGAGTALLYNLFKHEKEIILIQGTELVFVVSRTLDASNSVLPHDASKPAENSAGPPLNWM